MRIVHFGVEPVSRLRGRFWRRTITVAMPPQQTGWRRLSAWLTTMMR